MIDDNLHQLSVVGSVTPVASHKSRIPLVPNPNSPKLVLAEMKEEKSELIKYIMLLMLLKALYI